MSPAVVSELHHRLDGPSAAPGVMFVNSLGTDLTMWDPQANALAGEFRVLRYDQRGHGGSPAPPGPYSVEELGRDAIGLLDRLGLERVAIAGISLGGAVSMWVASEAPDRVERLVLCCTAARFGPPEPWLERARQVREEGMGAISAQVVERWFTREFRETTPETVARFERGLLATDPDGYAACCEAIAKLDLRDRLSAINAPTVVVAAPHDPATPPALVREVAEGIDRAELTLLTDGAHLANVERATEVNPILRHHLTEEAS